MLIWGLKEDATPGQEDKIAHAKSLLREIDEKGDKGLIPSVVLGEFLMRVPKEHHMTVINLAQKSYRIAPYDTKAASIFGTLWQEYKAGTMTTLPADSGTREELKADFMIVATALAEGASVILSEDPLIVGAAAGRIPVRAVPENASQLAIPFPPR